MSPYGRQGDGSTTAAWGEERLVRGCGLEQLPHAADIVVVAAGRAD